MFRVQGDTQVDLFRMRMTTSPRWDPPSRRLACQKDKRSDWVGVRFQDMKPLFRTSDMLDILDSGSRKTSGR